MTQKHAFVGWFTVFVAFSASAADPKLDAIRAKYQIPGIAYGTLSYPSGKRTEQIAVSGTRRSDDPALLQSSDALHLGSITKSMTALLFAMAVKEGKLAYGTSVYDAFGISGSHAKYRKATLRDLLLHRAGVGDEAWVYSIFSDPALLDKIIREEIDPVNARRIVAGEILRAEPKTYPESTFEYSNPSFILIAALLENTYGKSWENLIRDRLFIPFSLTSCGLGPTSMAAETKNPSTVWAHQYGGSKGVYTPMHLDNPEIANSAGRVHCNLSDLMKYEELHLNLILGKSTLLDPAQTLEMYSASYSERYTPGGWVIIPTPAFGNVFAYDGSNTLNYASALIIPSKIFVFAAGTNAGSSDAQTAISETLNLAISTIP